MANFFRSRFGLDNEQGFVQGAGRILMAAEGTDYPEGFEDILALEAVVGSPGPPIVTAVGLYDAIDPWVDVGFTKTGINITRNNAEEDFDVDQVRASLRRRPTNWEMSIGTQLAEATLETYALAWELPDPTLVVKTGTQLDERHVGLSAPTSYVERLIAVIFQFPDAILRGWVFRRCQRAPQESGMTLNKTGEQVSLPQRWTALADPDADEDSQFGEIFEQVPA